MKICVDKIYVIVLGDVIRTVLYPNLLYNEGVLYKFIIIAPIHRYMASVQCKDLTSENICRILTSVELYVDSDCTL
jgi:hypothetical protein